jgi:hypothetical protein
MLRRTTAFLSVVAALAAPPPALNSVVSITSFADPSLSFRHCNYVASFHVADPSEPDDFQFKVVPARSGAPLPAISLQSINFPSMFIAPTGKGNAIGIVENADTDDASWNVVAGLAGPANTSSIVSLSKNAAFAGLFITYGTTRNAPCAYSAPNFDAVLDAGTVAAASTVYLMAPPPPPPPPPTLVTIDASAIDHVLPDRFLGCHMDPGYTNDPLAWTANMVYGSAFVHGPQSVYAWTDATTPGANGAAVLDPALPFAPSTLPSLSLTSAGSAGDFVGWANRGIGGEGLFFEANLYEGYAHVLAPAGTTLTAMIRGRGAGPTLATASVPVPASPSWQRVDFSLTPSAGTECVGIAVGSDPTVDCGEFGPNPGHTCVRCGGEFVIGLAQAGALHVGFVWLMPGTWGRLGDLPVLKAGADNLRALGISVIRQGGTVSQSFAWKEWRGPPAERVAMNPVWGKSLVAPWGPFDFIDMANALDIEPILTLAYDLNTADDWADLVEYLYGDETTAWGSVRVHNDSHPAPFQIKTFELGNEEANPSFAVQIAAIEAKRKQIPNAPEWNFMCVLRARD